MKERNNPQFQSVKAENMGTNVFDLSHERAFTGNIGDLIPILVQEVIPGDTFNVSSEVFGRLQALLSPAFTKMNVFVEFWFVPKRLTFSGWEPFITGGADGKDNTVWPKITLNDGWKADFAKGKLPDYMGIPVPPTGTITQDLLMDATKFRAYQMIYNENYRDQNLSSEVSFALGSTVSAADQVALTTLRKRSWEKDYFTSALPWDQRGDEVYVPLEGTIDFQPDYLGQSYAIKTADGTGAAGDMEAFGGLVDAPLGTDVRIENLFSSTDYDIEDGEILLNDIRTANKLQMFQERMARIGTRYIEYTKGVFNVSSKDARLQRPEFLGGSKNPFQISEVLQTSESGTTEQGNMAGHGITVGRSNAFNRYFEEHGDIIGILSVIPRSAYSQGLERQWTKFDRFDHYVPDFAHLGEQEVKNNELYYDPFGTTGTAGFGYQSRFAEYKYKPSSIHGDLRDNLSYWTNSRIFTALPGLNEQFVTCDNAQDGLDRIFAITDPTVNKLIFNVYTKCYARRKMPVFGTPQL